MPDIDTKQTVGRLVMDVTDKASILKAYEEVKSKEGRLHILVNK